MITIKLLQFIVFLISVTHQIMSPPTQSTSRSDFQTYPVTLLSSSSSSVISNPIPSAINSQTFNITYVNYAQPVSTVCSTALGIITNSFDFIGSPFNWNVTIGTSDCAGINVTVYVNTSNSINLLTIIYLVTNNPYFQLGYIYQDFSNSILNSTSSNTRCSSLTDPIRCRRLNTFITLPVLMDSNTTINVFLSGVLLDGDSTGTYNHSIGIKISVLSIVSNTFTLQTIAYDYTIVWAISYYYVAIQQDTLNTTTSFNLFLSGRLSFCSSCSSPTTTKSISNAGFSGSPVDDLEIIYGFNQIYASNTTSANLPGYFDARNITNSGTTYTINLTTASGNFQTAFDYLIFKTLTCTNSIDIYFTLDRNYCNLTCNGGINQYYDVNNYCQSCDSKCYTCVGSPTTCTSCYASQNRVLNGSSCDCNPYGFYNDSTLLYCPSCYYTCLTCNGSTNSSCITCNSSVNYRTYNSTTTSCPCNDGYYDAGYAICYACSYTCLTCQNGSLGGCLTCNATNQRTILNGFCVCQTGFFENGVALCAPCSYTCYSCSSNTVCTNCTTTYNRTLIGASCPCNSGYYDQGPNNGMCLICNSTCAACNGPTPSNCLSCNPLQNRALVLSSCLCITNYYSINLNTSPICGKCDLSCNNCTGPLNTQCINCVAANFRTFDIPTNTCLCNPGWFDSGLASCLPCSYTCATCNINSTNCLTCNATNHRSTLQGSTCLCDDGYADTLSAMCQPCHYSCLTCNSVLSTGCLTCNAAYRNLSSAQCLCPSNQTDSNVSVSCLNCHYTCLTCNNIYATSCLTCNTTSTYRILTGNSCPCATGYYDVGTVLCSACNATCYTCSIILTNCTTCNIINHRTIVNFSCLCTTGYYESGVAMCATCLSRCLNCSGINNNCTACDSLNNFRTLLNYDCICLDGYFDSGATVCQACAYQCLTCNGTSVNCTSCNASTLRTLSSGTCPCNGGYFDSGISLCQPCPYSCLTCSGPLSTNCITCNSVTYLRNLTNGNTCTCPAGYYDNGFNPQCLSCFSYCITCSTYSVCTQCNTSGTYRYLNATGSCVCSNGYFDNLTLICATCHLFCLICNGPLSTNCLSCNASNFRVFSNFQCNCINGYYSTGLALCSICNNSCATCLGSSTNCTSCAPSSNRYYLLNTCFCQAGYYDNGGTICLSCTSPCATCNTTSTNCLSCIIALGSILNGNLCVCPSNTYLNISNNYCSSCHPYCLTCSSNTNTSCITCYSSQFRYFFLSTNSCLCNSGYYEYGNPICGICHSNCLTCIGGNSSFNCTSCNLGYILMTSTCILNLTCPNYIFQGQCLTTCPNISYPNSSSCIKCINNCYTCTTNIICITCQPGFLFSPANSSCLYSCAPSQYILNSTCYNCPTNCQACFYNSNSSTILCINCSLSYYLYNYTCLQTCPPNTTVLVVSTCRNCLYPCSTCFGLNNYQCLSCASGFYLYGSSCTSPCPSTTYANLNTGYCNPCSSNCLNCSFLNNFGYCTKCTISYYSSNGVCVPQGIFLQNSLQIACHPNCKTCTNSSFSSCIKCVQYRGNNDGMAINGYCDCWNGTIDIGNGKCNPAIFNAVTKGNTFAIASMTGTLVFGAMTALLTSNPIMIQKFCGHLQMSGQFVYLNTSLENSLNGLLSTLGQTNLGNLIMKSNQSTTQKRILYTQSTQTIKSLFLHGRSVYYVYWTCLHIIISLTLIWGLILIIPPILKSLKKKYDKTSSKYYRKWIKILDYVLGLLKYSFPIKLMILTSTQASFALAVSIKLTDVQSFTNITGIGNFIVTTLLSIYYIAYLVHLIRIAIREKDVIKNQQQFKANSTENPYISLYNNFELGYNKWYHVLYLPMSFIRTFAIQCLIVAVSFQPFYQALCSLIIQIIFVLYTLISNPYKKPIKYLVYISEILFLGQLTMLVLITQSDANAQIPYSIALLVLIYATIGVFGLFCLIELGKIIWQFLKTLKSEKKSRKVVPIEQSEQQKLGFQKLEKNATTENDISEIQIKDAQDKESNNKKRYRVERKSHH